jgi:hypothetical protein
MKKILSFLIFVFFISGTCLGQGKMSKDYQKFVNSFVETIYEPIQTTIICKPVVCLIKIEVDSAKNVLDIKLSDSADSLLKARVDVFKKNIKTQLLTNFIKLEYANSTGNIFVIPLHLSTRDDACASPVIEWAKILAYSRFDGIFLSGNVIFLRPIYLGSTVIRDKFH